MPAMKPKYEEVSSIRASISYNSPLGLSDVQEDVPQCLAPADARHHQRMVSHSSLSQLSTHLILGLLRWPRRNRLRDLQRISDLLGEGEVPVYTRKRPDLLR